MTPIRIATFVAVLALAPAVAQAQSTYYACYVPKTGSVYRVKTADTPAACKQNHVEFSWQSGGGLVFTERSSEPIQIAPNGDFEQRFADCEADEIVVSGGHHVEPNASVSVAASKFFHGLGHHGWWVDVRNTSPGPILLYAHVICAKPAP